MEKRAAQCLTTIGLTVLLALPLRSFGQEAQQEIGEELREKAVELFREELGKSIERTAEQLREAAEQRAQEQTGQKVENTGE